MFKQIRFKRWIMAMALVLVPGLVQPQEQPSGAALYEEHCAVCHGQSGYGGMGVPLALPSFIAGVGDRYLEKTIRLGRPGRIMPAFPSLADNEVSAIVQHLRSWSDAPRMMTFDQAVIEGEPALGKQVYQQHCASCHGENGEGGVGTGVTFSRPRDLPIMAPALNNPGFLAAASDQMMRHTLINGREGTPMGSFLEQGLSERDIDNVISYIRSFTAKQFPVKPVDSEAVIIVESPNDFAETVESLRQAILGKNFRLIREQTLDQGLAAAGQENNRQHIIYFCNFDFLNKALATDPRVGMFLPCRVTVVERDGKVLLMTINPMHMSTLFNNVQLDQYCKQMRGIYEELLEEAAL